MSVQSIGSRGFSIDSPTRMPSAHLAQTRTAAVAGECRCCARGSRNRIDDFSTTRSNHELKGGYVMVLKPKKRRAVSRGMAKRGAVWYFRRQVKGKRRSFSTGQTDYKLAEIKATELAAQINRGEVATTSSSARRRMCGRRRVTPPLSGRTCRRSRRGSVATCAATSRWSTMPTT